MKSKNNSSFFFICRSFSLLLTVSLPLQPVWLYANPSGEQVVAGSASFHRNGSSLSIHQFSNRAIINWQDFSIALGELTEFLQPSRSSAVLNRVVGGNISEIYGTLKANGSVFLINPNGVLIGPSGIIEVGSFVASTRDVSNEEFLQGGPLNFTGNSTAELVNLGRISAQDDVYLMAEAVRNEGQMSAGREVGLAAGGAFYLQEQGEERFKVKLPHNGTARDTGVLNTGQIEAARATLQATGSAYSVAVNNGGVIRATGVQHTADGRVFLVGSGGGSVLNTGSISARNADGTGGTVKMAAGEGTLRHSGQVEVTGTTGGRAELTGERVAVTGRVDASGQQGGGRIYVGGSYQGREEPEIANAQRTLVGTTGELRADALESGDGGRIIVWANGDTAFHGTLSARGGLMGGNGGFAEISGKEALTLTGSTDLSAPQGQAGTLLLDPRDIIVTSAFSSTPLTAVDDFTDTPGVDQTIWDSTITFAFANVVLQANRDIFFNPGVNIFMVGNFDLTLRAGRSIFIGDGSNPANAHVGIFSFGGGNFTATINDNGAIAAHRDPGAAEFRLQNATVQFTGGGSFTVNSGTLDPAGGTIRFLGGNGANQYAYVLDADQINLTCQNDIVLQGGTGMFVGVQLKIGGNIHMTSSTGNITVQGGTGNTANAYVNTIGNLNMQANNGRILVQGGAGNTNYARAFATGAVTLAAGTQGLEVLGGTGPLSYAEIYGGGGLNLTQSGLVQVIGGSANNTYASIAGGVGGVQLNSTGNILLQGGSGGSAYASIAGGSGGVQLNSTGNILLEGGSADYTSAEINTTGGGNVSLTSTNGNIDVLGSTAAANQFSYALIDSSGTLDMMAANGRIRVQGGAGAGTFPGTSNYALAQATGAVTLAAGTQGLQVLGGTGPLSNAHVKGSGVTLTQSGGIQVIGGSGVSATATITGAAGGVQLNSTGNILLQGGSGDSATASITGAAGGVQLNSTGNILLQGGSANTTFAQIHTTGGGNISLISTNGNIDLLGSTTAANFTAYADIASAGTLNMQAANGGIRLRGGAGITDNYASALAFGAVTLSAGTQGLEVVGGTGLGSYALVLGFGAMNVTSAGDILVQGGSGNDTFAALYSLADQTINSANTITLTGGSALNTYARIEAMGVNQTITAANRLDMTGTGFTSEAYIAGWNPGTTTLNFASGTWSNEAYVQRPVAGGTVIVNNSGQLTINEQPGRFGYVRADTVEFQGAGTIGSNLNGPGNANTRLNTDVDHIFFNDPAKTLYFSEIDSDTTGGVTIRGIANHVDLITDTTGDILQGSSNFTAQSATLQTADGNINLNNPTNAVGTFQGLIANNGFISYSGLGTTTFAARAVSAEVPLVPDLTTGINNVGVFATNNITLNNPTGTFIVTTDEVLSNTGNVAITANTLQFNSANASTGGIHGPSGAEGWVYTPQGTQTYNVSSSIQLLRNTHMRADTFPNDTITFNGDIISPGGVAGLQVGSSPVFNGANVGTVPNPLAYLLFSNNAPSTITFTPNFYTAVINFSLINQNDAQMNIQSPEPTFIVDHGTVGPGLGLFQGGNMQVAGSLQIFGATPAQVTGNIGGLSPQLSTGQEFWAAWLGNPFTPQIPLPPFPDSFVAYKIPLGLGGGGGGGLGLGLSLEFLARDAWQDEDDNGGDRRRNPYRNQFKFLYQDRARATPAVLAGASSYQLYKEQLFERSELTHLIQQVERKKGEEVKLMNY